MVFITMWRDGGTQCLLVIGVPEAPYMLRLVDESDVVRSQVFGGPHEATDAAARWHAELGI